MNADIGVVAIGRNEGERLKACLRSIIGAGPVVYVDSESTDDSVAFAGSLGVAVVELAVPPSFTAARARNAGLAALLEQHPGLAAVQMIDGDCTLAPGWIAAGRAALDARPALAVVFGRLRERHPNASLYNALCDDEWDVPVGDVDACGGNAMFRVGPLRVAGGYDPALIAGEEPDLCQRLRADGWRVARIDAEMGSHDAAIHRFGQWWRRTERSGHAFAELASRHGRAGDPHWRRQCASIIAWAAVLPLAALVALALAWTVAIALILLYPLQIVRIARRQRRRGLRPRTAWGSGLLLVIGKFAQLIGFTRYHLRRMTGRPSRLIEHRTI